MTETQDEGGEPLGDIVDLEAWEPQLPTSDFAERVLTRVRTEGETTRPNVVKERRRRWGTIATGVTALALAAAVLLRVSAPPAKGEAIAKERIEVEMGSRALAVLEPGAAVRWDGDDVVQSRGDVFYRVERGKVFTVHTPAGDVEVKGTCFSVKVRPVGTGREESDMVKRDLKAGAVGATLSALAFVAVYEGKVAVSHASSSVELRAGESAQAGAGGVKHTGGTAEGEKAFAESAAPEGGDDPLGAANKNLVRQVSEYRSRLETIAAQKSELETKLKRSEERLAASQDGAAAPWKSDFDLSQDDWKELAKEGTVKYQVPCFRKEPWTPSPENLRTLGLSPQDGATLRDAYAHSNQRLWSELKPLCARAVGSAEVAEKIGAGTCVHLILDIEAARDREAAKAATKQVGEIRAGQRPMPGPNEPANAVLKLFLATTGEAKNFETELAQSFGPEEAHRILFSDELCMEASTFSGSRPSKK